MIFSNSDAASTANIQTQHCFQCGSILLGSAHIDFDAIHWAGGDIPGVLRLSTRSESFGFSGPSLYLSEAGRDNQWKFKSSREVVISNPNRFGPSMNHFFAPTQVDVTSSSHLYTLLDPSDSQIVRVQGSGIADNEVNPALTLAIQADIPVCPQEAVCSVNVSTGRTITFTVTPQVEAALVPIEVSQAPQYAFIELLAQEQETQCSQIAPTFKDRGITENSFEPNDYFHYLQGFGPLDTPEDCIRYYPFLVSLNKPFQFQIMNQRDTGNGYVQYDFYIRGHYDPDNPSRWLGSHKSFRLSTATAVPTAAFTLAQHNNVITLDASASTTPNAGLVEYQWYFEPALSDKDNPVLQTTPMTEVLITQSGTYQITLIVIDNIGSRAQSTSQTVTIQTQPVIAQFTAQPLAGQAPLEVKLDASTSQAPAGSSITHYEWTAPGQSPRDSQLAFFTFEHVGEYPITLTVTADNGSSDSTTQTVTVLAPPTVNITLQEGDKPQGHVPHSVTFMPTASAPNGMMSGYEWLINGRGIESGSGQPKPWQHTFETAGTYSVELKVSDDQGGFALSTPQTITVWKLPVARFQIEQLDNQVILTSTAEVDDRLSVQEYQWRVEDQEGNLIYPLIGTDKQPAEVSLSLEAGTYDISLQIIDIQGKIDNTNDAPKTITVEASQAIFAKFIETSLFAPAIVHLDAGASYTTDQSQITDYSWGEIDYTLFDTAKDDLPYQILFEKNDNPAQRWFQFNQAGDYRIRLTVTNNEVDDTLCDNITILMPNSSMVTYPSLDDGHCHSLITTATGVDTFADSHFRGGISVNGEPFKNNIVLANNTNQTVEIAVRILVAAAHVGQRADILIALKHSHSEKWYFRSPVPENSWKSHDNLADATAYKTGKKLSKVMDIPIFSGELNPLAGIYSLYMGYRLVDDSNSVNIIFNIKPIQFEVQDMIQ